MSNRNGGGGRVPAKVENPPKVSKSASRKLCKKLASITTENQICGQNWSDSGKRRENDGLVVYGNGLIVYGKQKRQTHCWLSLLGASTGQCSQTCCAGRILFVTGWLQGTIIYFESFCLGRTQSQHFSYVLVKETLPTTKVAITGETPILNQAYYKDSKVGRGLQRWNQKPENSQG